jgi:hypothetical protein
LATVGGATVDRNQMIENHTRPRPGLCLCIDFLKSVVGFTVFMMAFLRLHKILAYLETTPASTCVVKGKNVVCEVVNFIVIFHTFYALFFWLAVFRRSYNNIFLLFLASTHF